LGHVARTDRTKIHPKFGQQNRKEKHYLEDLGVDEMVILNPVLKEQDGRVWTGFSHFSTGNSCEHDRTPGFNKIMGTS
jgi:hypothetical protein